MRLAAVLGGFGASCRGAAGVGAGVWVGAGVRAAVDAAGGVGAAAGAVDGIGAVDGMKAPAKAAAGGGTGFAEGPKVAPDAGADRMTGLVAAKSGAAAPEPPAVGTENSSPPACVGVLVCGAGSEKSGMMSMALPWTGIPEDVELDVELDADVDGERVVFPPRGPRPFRLRTCASSNKRKSPSPMTT